MAWDDDSCLYLLHDDSTDDLDTVTAVMPDAVGGTVDVAPASVELTDATPGSEDPRPAA